MKYLHYYEKETGFDEDYYGTPYLEPWTSFIVENDRAFFIRLKNLKTSDVTIRENDSYFFVDVWGEGGQGHWMSLSVAGGKRYNGISCRGVRSAI